MKKLLRILLLIIFIVTVQFTFAQQDTALTRLINRGNKLLEKELFGSALPVWLEILKQNPDNSNCLFKVGLCYHFSLDEKIKALPYFKKAVKNTTSKYDFFNTEEENAPKDAIYFLAESYLVLNKIDSALTNFILYRNQFEETSPPIDVTHKISQCINAMNMKNSPINIRFKSIGENINTISPEANPVVSLDNTTIFFSSRKVRKDKSNDSILDEISGKHFDDIYFSKKDASGNWKKSELFEFSSFRNDAPLCISSDGKTLYIRKQDEKGYDLYYCSYEAVAWSGPQALNSNINSGYNETGLSISTDNNLLFFASDRESGIGKSDIYMCRKQANDKWSKAKNLRSVVNTPFNEIYPFIHPNGKTLYFSSNGHKEKSMGGYDIYFTKLQDDGTWSEPKNAGYPINTTRDDFYYYISADGKRYYSGLTKENSYDIFSILEGGYDMADLDDKAKILELRTESEVVGVIEVEKEKEVAVTEILEVEKEVETEVEVTEILEVEVEKEVKVEKEVEVLQIEEVEKEIRVGQINLDQIGDVDLVDGIIEMEREVEIVEVFEIEVEKEVIVEREVEVVKIEEIEVEKEVLRIDTLIVHDTVEVLRIDTLIQIDTLELLRVDTLIREVLRVDTLIQVDTLIKEVLRVDTLIQIDTLIVVQVDTLIQIDTLIEIQVDTLIQIDTLEILRVDTLIQEVLRVDTLIQIDTLIVVQVDTLIQIDTLEILRVDTVIQIDTLIEIQIDTLIQIDTVEVLRIDTLIIIQIDTVEIVRVDTLILIDTVEILRIDTVEVIKEIHLGEIYADELGKADNLKILLNKEVVWDINSYQKFFKNNKKHVIKPEELKFKIFIENLDSLVRKKGEGIVFIESSINKSFGSISEKDIPDDDLAKLRAENTKKIILSSLAKKGTKSSDVYFYIETFVQGPVFENKKEYRKYRKKRKELNYVKMIAF